jgi:hypothetical protein
VITKPIKREAGILRKAMYEHTSAGLRAGILFSGTTIPVLANDPYRLDTPANHRDGQWVAEQLERAIGPYRLIHWRGLHYAIVVVGDIRKPNGEIYLNTDEDWNWLSKIAGMAARWLRYVPFDRITDARNSDPVIYRRARPNVPEGRILAGSGIHIPSVPTSSSEVFSPKMARLYGCHPSKASTSIWGSSMDVAPIARRYECDLYLQTGEMSDTRIHQMASGAVQVGRPLIVFTLCDFDPAGYQMPVSIGRKLQALRDLEFPILEFDVVPVGLNIDQVRDLGLPRRSRKKSGERTNGGKRGGTSRRNSMPSQLCARMSCGKSARMRSPLISTKPWRSASPRPATNGARPQKRRSRSHGRIEGRGGNQAQRNAGDG